MSVIWKFPVKIEDQFSLDMPQGARVLCVQTQGDSSEPFVWAEVNPDAEKESRKFRLFGTGHPMEAGEDWLEYIGTFQIRGGAIVFHLYEVDDMDEIPF